MQTSLIMASHEDYINLPNSCYHLPTPETNPRVAKGNLFFMSNRTLQSYGFLFFIHIQLKNRVGTRHRKSWVGLPAQRLLGEYYTIRAISCQISSIIYIARILTIINNLSEGDFVRISYVSRKINKKLLIHSFLFFDITFFLKKK